MIKKIIAAFIILGGLPLFAQQQNQQQNSNVELPDFVIMGKDVVKIRSTQKIAPDFVPTLSEKFIKPVFSPEHLGIHEFPAMNNNTLKLPDSLNYIKGNLGIAVGNVSLPSAHFSYVRPFDHGMFEGYGSGENSRAYVPNSGKYSLNAGANLRFFIDNAGGFLPGTQFKLHGDYGTSSYKLFASADPGFKRTFNKSNIGLDVTNFLSKIFNFALKIDDKDANLQNENFKENMLGLHGFTGLELSAFSLNIKADYNAQRLSNDSVTNVQTNFIQLRPAIGLNLSNSLNASFGIDYAKSGGENLFYPYASVGIRIDRGLSFFGEYSPEAEFLGGNYWLNINPYFRTSAFQNFFYKKNSAFNLNLKYEYYTYFEIDGGLKYLSSSNMPYLSDASQKGKFDLLNTDGRSVTGYINFLFHPGPYGVFYGTAKINDTRDTSNNFIPYSPRAEVNVNYGYYFDFGLHSEINLDYKSDSYSDLANTGTVNSYMDLGLKFTYTLMPKFYLSLKAANLLNHQNYIWAGYKERPSEFAVGLNYRW